MREKSIKTVHIIYDESLSIDYTVYTLPHCWQNAFRYVLTNKLIGQGFIFWVETSLIRLWWNNLTWCCDCGWALLSPATSICTCRCGRWLGASSQRLAGGSSAGGRACPPGWSWRPCLPPSSPPSPYPSSSSPPPPPPSAALAVGSLTFLLWMSFRPSVLLTFSWAFACS